MKNQFLFRHKYSLICVVLCLLCLGWFLLDPCLNLSYLVQPGYYHIGEKIGPFVAEISEILDAVSLYFPLLAYLFFVSLIVMSCYLAAKFGLKFFGYWLAGIIVLIFMLAGLTGFPDLGSISMLWCREGIDPMRDIGRYTWLFDWLILSNTTLFLYIVVLTFFKKRRDKNKAAQ